MEQELISKKDILEVTGISYGQLYRWKRKELIPEEWFIKKSSYTGQETYFPKKKILERINKIMELKDKMPLDELAEMFSNKTDIRETDGSFILGSGFVRDEVLKIYESMLGKSDVYKSKELVLMYVLQEQLDLGQSGINEIETMIRIMDKEYENLEKNNGTVYMIRRLGVTICIAAFSQPIVIDSGSKVIAAVNIKDVVDKVKFKISSK